MQIQFHHILQNISHLPRKSTSTGYESNQVHNHSLARGASEGGDLPLVVHGQFEHTPGRKGPNKIRPAGKGPSAVRMDTVVTVKHMLPNFWKIVNVQKFKKRDAPAVVTAQPSVAPPMDFKAKVVRISRCLVRSLSTSTRGASCEGPYGLAYL